MTIFNWATWAHEHKGGMSRITKGLDIVSLVAVFVCAP